jgi:hypothetical protein
MTIAELDGLMDDAKRTTSAALDAIADLGTALRQAGDHRASEALNAYMWSTIAQLATSEGQCGGLLDAEDAIHCLSVDGDGNVSMADED